MVGDHVVAVIAIINTLGFVTFVFFSLFDLFQGGFLLAFSLSLLLLELLGVAALFFTFFVRIFTSILSRLLCGLLLSLSNATLIVLMNPDRRYVV